MSGSARSASPRLRPLCRRPEAVHQLKHDESPDRDDRGDERLVKHLRRYTGAEVADRERGRVTVRRPDTPAIAVAELVCRTGRWRKVAGADGCRPKATAGDAARVPAVDADRDAARLDARQLADLRRELWPPLEVSRCNRGIERTEGRDGEGWLKRKAPQ